MPHSMWYLEVMADNPDFKGFQEWATRVEELYRKNKLQLPHQSTLVLLWLLRKYDWLGGE